MLSEKVGCCWCWWVTSRSGWLLELLTELINIWILLSDTVCLYLSNQPNYLQMVRRQCCLTSNPPSCPHWSQLGLCTPQGKIVSKKGDKVFAYTIQRKILGKKRQCRCADLNDLDLLLLAVFTSSQPGQRLLCLLQLPLPAQFHKCVSAILTL